MTEHFAIYVWLDCTWNPISLKKCGVWIQIWPYEYIILTVSLPAIMPLSWCCLLLRKVKVTKIARFETVSHKNLREAGSCTAFSKQMENIWSWASCGALWPVKGLMTTSVLQHVYTGHCLFCRRPTQIRQRVETLDLCRKMNFLST